MKLLITGAGGFLGHTIVHQFSSLGWDVCGIGRSVEAPTYSSPIEWRMMPLPDPTLAELLLEQRPDLIVHTAGSASVARSVEDPLYDFTQSVDVWSNVLDAVRRSGILCRVIFLSSAAVYGNPDYLPIDENYPTKPVSPYGYHKRMCEEIMEYYVRLYGLSICCARIFSAYGPGLRRQVVWDICQQALVDGAIKLSGTGHESRDFIHATDVARAVAYMASEGDFKAGIYNVASGVSTSIRELADKIVHLLKAPIPITFSGQSRSGDPLQWQADVTKLTLGGFECQKSLDTGLHEYLDWVLQQSDLELVRRSFYEKAARGRGHQVPLF